jgi:hypothetical protein
VFCRARLLRELGGIKMKLKIGVVLLAALAIEAVNFRFGGLALDPGNFSDMTWYQQLTATEWVLLHAVGLIVLDWLERGGASGSPGTLTVHPPGSLPPVNLSPHSHWGTGAVIFIGGYLSTALVLLALTFGIGRFLRWKRERSAGAAELANQIYFHDPIVQ